MKLNKILLTFIFFITITSINAQVYVKSTAAGANNGNSWADAYTDVQDGINDAAGGGEDVWVAAGTYQHGSQMNLRNGVTVYGGFPNIGNPGWGDRNYTANQTILSGNNAYRVIYNNGGGIDATAVLDGCIIQDGNVAGQGAGIYINNCSPTYRNCIIRNNTTTAGNDGGGVYIRSTCTSIFTNCTIENNTAADNAGGIDILLTGCNPTFTNCTIDNNHSSDHGGGIRIYRCSPTFDNCNITNNIIDVAARNGGGIYIESNAANISNPSIINCTITGNTATQDGGGIYSNSPSWTNTLSGNTISNNDAIDDGGGIYLTNAGCNPVFTNSTIDGNHADDNGGGVFINACNPTFNNCNVRNNILDNVANTGGGFQISGAADPTITNCTITGNLSTNTGGGIYSNSSSWTNALSSNTISSNSAIGADANNRGRGGGLYIDNSCPDITNNTISNNVTGTSGAFTGGGRGGGIYFYRAGFTPTLSGNTITGNSARTTGTGTGCGYGGGLYFDRTDVITLDNNTISSNKAQTYGGGIYMYQSAPIVTNNIIDGNQVNAYIINTGYGGGLCIYDDTGTGTSPTLTSNTISNNQADDGGNATSGFGAGIYIRSGVDPNCTLNTITGNTASQRGGAIYIQDGGTNPIFNRNSINSNTAIDGGAIYIRGDRTPEFYNNLIYSNTATNGGAFYFYGTDLGTYLNNTVANNTATNGGGAAFYNNADLHLTNTIFWGNSGAGSNIFINDGASDPFFENCVVEGGTAAFTGGGAGGYNAGNYTNNIEVDPLFVGAPGDLHITKPTSPCIGAGDAGTVVGDFPADEDYEANTRVLGTVDIGAYETNNAPQFVVSLGPIVDDPGPKVVNMSEDETDALGAPDPFVLTLNAHDLDDQNITWSVLTQASNGIAVIPAPLTVGPPWMSTKNITYTPNADFNGTDQFVIQVSDGTLTDQITVDVNIASINDAPVFNSTAVTISKATHLYTYNINTTDVDNVGTDLSITSVPALPGWLTLTDNGNGTALLTGTPLDGDVGVYNIQLRVTDPEATPPDNYSDQIFTITVATRIVHVPADFPTIQQAIDAGIVVDGDKIEVAAGTYNENINFNGKNIEIEGNPANPSSVIINGGGNGAVVRIENGEAGLTSLNGFTLTNGSGRLGVVHSFSLHAPISGFYGGGVYCYQSSPLLKNLIIENNTLLPNNNHGGSGAGIYIGNNSNVTIEGPNTIIRNNTSTTYRGGGICIDNSTVTINGTGANGVRIENNNGGNYGGGIAIYESTLDLTDIRVTNNSVDGANGSGGGVYSHASSITPNAGIDVSGNSATVGNNDVHLF